jgi:hypothetical protein
MIRTPPGIGVFKEISMWTNMDKKGSGEGVISIECFHW